METLGGNLGGQPPRGITCLISLPSNKYREERMEIKIGDLTLTSEYSSVYKTRIIGSKDGVKLLDVDSESLKIAIEALEKSCWRP